jgi:hypothetical protein
MEGGDEDNTGIKVDLREVMCGGEDWIQQAQCSVMGFYASSVQRKPFTIELVSIDR